jgi:membrane protein required for colicin V production
MTWFDILIVVVIALAALTGARQAFPRALVPFGGVVAATFIAGLLYDNLAESMSTIVTDDYDARVIGFLAIFAAVYFASQLVSMLAAPLTALLLLAPWTRTAGLVFGAFAGVLLVDALLIFLVTYPSLGLEDAVNDSGLAPLFVDDFPVMRYLLPAEFDAAAAGFE